MSDNHARIKISLKDGEFELSGSELFVSQQIDSFRELIVDSLKDKNFELKTDHQNSIPELPVFTEVKDAVETSNGNNAQSYPRIFHVDDDKISIIKRAPGNNNARKSINTALLYLWASKSMGIKEVTFSEVRDLCKEQGCLDGANFSSHMKSAKEYIIVEGSGKSQKMKLTLPGSEKVEELISEMS